ncbi:MAG: phosphomannomutase/phosphoglucomutase [Alphaproteobacteria bacterium]
MFPRPVAKLSAQSVEYETTPLVRPTGFREYDARWLLGEELNLMGVQALGMGLGTLLGELDCPRDIVTGHDFRSYSLSVKQALITGLMASGCRVRDIGLALSPMAYYAQFALDVPAVAMVTASHNANGWTGVKMGADRPVTFGPDEMTRLKEIVLGAAFTKGGGGNYEFIAGFPEIYAAALADRPMLGRKLKVVVACGNGTAGAFAPGILERIGCEVVPLDCELDYTFPRYNPNPEDMKMLAAMRHAVLESGADVGLGFDGDGDRCGIVDNEGVAIFADKVGVLLARDLVATHGPQLFIVDVKATGLYQTDLVLAAAGAKVEYWKTGHSHIKRRVRERGALAGFEKSGHFFFNAPIGHGYDDGIVAAIAVCDMLDRAKYRTLADLQGDLAPTWGSPTMSPHCPDEAKYGIVSQIVGELEAMQNQGKDFAGQPIADLITVNGARIVNPDGTWGLVRASSNLPELVVVVESPVSEARMRDMFAAVDAMIRQHPQVGDYNQTIP